MITKEFLQDIIAKDEEPLYALHGVMSACPISEREVLWHIIEDIAFHGNERERMFTLKFIAYGSRKLANKLQDLLIPQISDDFAKNERIVDCVISMIWRTKRKDNLPFCLSVLKWAKGNARNNLLFSHAFNCIVTIDWEEISNEIVEVLMDEDDLGIIDTVAYFLYENGSTEYGKFSQSLPQATLQRISTLMPDINERLNDHYRLLKEDKDYEEN